MVNNRNPHWKQNVFPNQTNTLKNQPPHGTVRQDKHAPERVRGASSQPVTPGTTARTPHTDTKSPRTQNHSTSRPKVQVAAWVTPSLKAELQRIAKQQGLSGSQAIGALLEEAVLQQLHVQHAVLLQPLIQQAIAKQMRGISTRLAWLLVRVAYDSGQTRSLVTNILGRQPGITPDLLKTILAGSGKTAKSNITRRTSQIVELIEVVEKWMLTEEEEQE